MYSQIIAQILLSALLGVSVSSVARAGGQDTGGGVGYTCNNGKSVLMVDFYEAKKAGRPIQLSPSLPTYQKKVTDALQRLSAIAPVRAKIYQDYFAEMLDGGIEWSKDGLFNESDFSDIEIPDGCKPLQVAFQRDETSIGLGQKRYAIQINRFNHMNENDKAVLILHELVYRDLFQGTKASGTHARMVTEKLFSVGLTSKEYATLMAYRIFKVLEWSGLPGYYVNPSRWLWDPRNPAASIDGQNPPDDDAPQGNLGFGYTKSGEFAGIRGVFSGYPTSPTVLKPQPSSEAVLAHLPACINVSPASDIKWIDHSPVERPGAFVCTYTLALNNTVQFMGENLSLSARSFPSVGMVASVLKQFNGNFWVSVFEFQKSQHADLGGVRFQPVQDVDGENMTALNFDFGADGKIRSVSIDSPMKISNYVILQGTLAPRADGRLCFDSVTCTADSANLCPAVGTCLN